MKLFRKKETLYGNLVKYSHKTALENPEMILREYLHKIQKLEDEARELKKHKTKYSFKVKYRSSHGWTPQSKLTMVDESRPFGMGIYPSYYYEGYIRFDQPKILEFVDVEPEALLQAVNYNKEIDVRLTEISTDRETLKKEKEKFVKTYKVE
jgi:hypothetical protein